MVVVERLLVYYQSRMEQFYNAMADVIFQKNYSIYLGERREVGIPYPEMFVFEESIYSEPYDDTVEEMLGHVVAKGFRIAMDFYAPDILNGNLTVKIRDKWFAFGDCRNENTKEQYPTEIWPLKYVLPNLRQLEVKLRYAIPILPCALG